MNHVEIVKDEKHEIVSEFEFIHFFRAIASFWVLAAHCMIWGGWYGIPLPSAKMAVDLFMMISGYLMAASAFSKNNDEPLSTLRNWFRFWLRRLFRLAPAYYLSLALAIVTSSNFLNGYRELQRINPAIWTVGGVYDPMRIEYTFTNVMLHLSFLFGLHPSYSFSTFLPDWSLSLEMQFYFVFPALIFLMRRCGFLKIAIFAGLITIVVGYSVARLVHYYEPSLLFFKLQYFISGILLFRALSANTIVRKRCALAACAVFLVSLDFQYGTQLFVLPLLVISMLFLGWLEAINRTPVWMSSLINSRLTRFASNTSYSVYLFHGFFISASGLILSGQAGLIAMPSHQRVFAMFLFVAISAYLVSYVVYLWIELPGIRLGKYLIQKVAPIRNCA
jgi:peptidoglycan/LPS O-acetylase OafA/YrhL